MKFISLQPFVPSGKEFQKSKELFVALGFKINWDGGGSSQIYVAPPLRSTADPSPLYREGTDDVPVALGLFLKAGFPQ